MFLFACGGNSNVKYSFAPDTLTKQKALLLTFDYIKRETNPKDSIIFNQEPEKSVKQINDSVFYVDNYFDRTNELKEKVRASYTCYVIHHTGYTTVDSLKIKEWYLIVPD